METLFARVSVTSDVNFCFTHLKFSSETALASHVTLTLFHLNLTHLTFLFHLNLFHLKFTVSLEIYCFT